MRTLECYTPPLYTLYLWQRAGNATVEMISVNRTSGTTETVFIATLVVHGVQGTTHPNKISNIYLVINRLGSHIQLLGGSIIPYMNASQISCTLCDGQICTVPTQHTSEREDLRSMRICTLDKSKGNFLLKLSCCQ